MTEDLKILGIKIENVLGLTEFELTDIGDLTEIRAANGQGKTSVLKAIALALSGSTEDPALLHQGAESGNVFLRLSNGSTIRRPVTAKGAQAAQVTEPSGLRAAKPESLLKGLHDALSLDPVGFVSMQPKEQIQAVLRAFPVKAPIAEIREALDGVQVPGVVQDLDLDMIDTLVGVLRENRTARNAERTKLQKTLETMKASVPSEAQGAEAEGALEDAQAKRAFLVGAREAKVKTNGKALEKEIEDLSTAEAQAIADLKEKFGKRRADVRAIAGQKADAIMKEHAPLIAAAETEIGRLQERRDQAAGARQAREYLKTVEADLVKTTADWKALDAAVKNTEALKVTLCARLPLKGVMIEDGELKLQDQHGAYVPVRHLNGAEQIKFATKLAIQRSGQLKAVLVDGFEALTAEAREAFLEEIRDSGCQVFVAIAEDCDGLEVSTR